ncbi:hypothetical protein JZ751_022505 [Albula glossodonta]|uniref:Ig-like domain-containing protein n=1 Tax=Albula glossodonta TaxID=121402 RepID=A0A8T2NU01_9TELE|nr:hypothetical protein JZ751_022505 [Albula glossodonta]
MYDISSLNPVNMCRSSCVYVYNIKSLLNLSSPAPVSKPVLSQLCLPHGELRVSCSSEGDVSEYSWTLGSTPLNRSVAYLNDKTNVVILRKNISGDLTCTARNNISQSARTIQLSTCPDHNKTQELVYAEVTGLSVKKRQSVRERTPVSEVVYGQIKAPGDPANTEGRAQGQEEAIYAKVHK